jgi:hypothetical protein
MSSRKILDLPNSERLASISVAKPTWRASVKLAALAWLILCVDCSECLARQFINEQQLDSSIFQTDRDATGARRRLDSQLSLQLEEIDRVCKLTEAQKVKLQLAARGDIKRFFDRYQTLKRSSSRSIKTSPIFRKSIRSSGKRSAPCNPP